MCVSRVSHKDSLSKPVGLANVSLADKEEDCVIQKHLTGDSRHEWAPSKPLRECRSCKREGTLQNTALAVKHPSPAPREMSSEIYMCVCVCASTLTNAYADLRNTHKL